MGMELKQSIVGFNKKHSHEDKKRAQKCKNNILKSLIKYNQSFETFLKVIQFQVHFSS